MGGAAQRVQKTSQHALPTRSNNPPNSRDQATARMILEAIATYLNQRESTKLFSGSVYTILMRDGLIAKSHRLRKQRTFIRFAREHRDSLWQTNIKCHSYQHLMAFLDDCSRYVPAASLCSESTTDTVLETLEEALFGGRIPK